MIRAKFYKAERTETGITYTLKGELDKSALHSAVDLQGEECIIGVANNEPVITEDIVIRARFALMHDWFRQEYERGMMDATQGTQMTEFIKDTLLKEGE